MKLLLRNIAKQQADEIEKIQTELMEEHQGKSTSKVVLGESKAIRKKTIFGALALGLLATASSIYLWNNRPCEVSTEARISGACYKNLTRTPLVIGVLTNPEDYVGLKAHLQEQFDDQILDVVIEGNYDTSYQDARNEIAQLNWDIAFAYSPMNGITARDNGYSWVGRMFPALPTAYQSALYVRADSSIQSINDITSSTIVALGNFGSASSFYMPAYDLFGKSFSVMMGYRSSEIKEMVANGQVDIGAGTYSAVKDEPLFRVIHASREIPGSGVYLSPKLSPVDQRRIREILLNAPEEIKSGDQANYSAGDEPDYSEFREISLKSEEVLRCADFDQNPVQFFCNQLPEGITGRISGWTNQDNDLVSLKLIEEGNKIYYIAVPLQVLSGVPNGTSPGAINGKVVNVVDVQPQERKDGAFDLHITAPNQLIVLQNP
jgi:ABC-type phosphate/phosphonate transport system substrate-binding protein